MKKMYNLIIKIYTVKWNKVFA